MADAKKISVAELFSKFHVTLKEAWLNEVLEYLQVERANADIPTVVQLVYEQWLFSELSNSTRPKIRLPPFEKKTFLDSDVAVQINWLVDIHTSMYSKLNQYLGRNLGNSSLYLEPNEETEDLDPANRIYLMEVTDGQRKLRAIEYQKIDKLCGKLSCGTKLIIRGGTFCRRNVLLLGPDNVMILGGESEICQQNTSALIIARRLGIDEKKLKLVECVRNEEYKNSVKTVEVTETEGAEKIQAIVPSVFMRKDVAANSSEQQTTNIHTNRTVKGENVRGKKQKRPVLSRTITSYFQPQHKIPTSGLTSKVSAKSQISLVNQETKEKSEPRNLAWDSLQKQREVKPPPALLPVADSKQQSQHSIATITFSRESNEPSAEQSGPPVVVSQVLCQQKIMNDSAMQSEIRKITEKSITTVQDQTQNVQNFRAFSQFMQPEKASLQPEKASLSARLWKRNFETTRSLVVEGNNSPTPPARKINPTYDAVMLSGESERKETTAKPLILIRTMDLQRNSADTIRHAAVISSSDIQERTIWTANKWYLLLPCFKLMK
ncbi:hypothetical protein LOAG_07525 [Loa loa]|uniref:RecQ-mediated genome instability protein 1 n=1 Tax=Loa loa TaxID=7209 RepID=A0A1S0TX38_LOALO|nr:hypothetical protein LOAG_07525 [Loa loa]EFO20968.1 hypothetical protein LOAG_07525 [Loa loa]